MLHRITGIHRWHARDRSQRDASGKVGCSEPQRDHKAKQPRAVDQEPHGRSGIQHGMVQRTRTPAHMLKRTVQCTALYAHTRAHAQARSALHCILAPRCSNSLSRCSSRRSGSVAAAGRPLPAVPCRVGCGTVLLWGMCNRGHQHVGDTTPPGRLWRVR